MVVVENVHTGVQSTFTDAEWANVQTKKEWQNTFKVVNTDNGNPAKKNVPKEIADLEQGKTPAAVQEAAGANKEAAAAPEVPKEVKEAAPKAAKAATKKPIQENNTNQIT